MKTLTRKTLIFWIILIHMMHTTKNTSFLNFVVCPILTLDIRQVARKHETATLINFYSFFLFNGHVCMWRNIQNSTHLLNKKNQSISKSLRSSHWRCSVRKGVLRNVVKFTEKHLWQSLFFNKFAGLCNFIKKETLPQVFFCEFCDISKNTFYTEHLWVTASDHCVKYRNIT